MKNPALSLWLSAANQAAGWWMGQAMGHGANAVRRQQRAMLAEMTKAATDQAGKPKRKPRPAGKVATRASVRKVGTGFRKKSDAAQ